MATLLSSFEPSGECADSRCRIALAGFGTVGRSVARLLHGRSDCALQVTRIFNRNVARKKVNWIGADVQWTERFEDLLHPDVDIVLELMGDVDVAHQLVTRALRSHKSVVTANKQLMAHFGAELLHLAKDNGQHLGYGASVAGGVPVLSAMEEGLAGDSLSRVRGIFNGTCNYILTRMEGSGIAFADALAEAQEAGFAEADPSDDVDGMDAAAKLAIVARIAFHADVSPRQVSCRSIRRIAGFDFAYARELDCTIRQISTAALDDEGCVHLSVGPALVPAGSPFAKVTGSQNLVVTRGQFGGDTSFGGIGAGGDATAVAVVSDLLQAARHRLNPTFSSSRRFILPAEIVHDLVTPYYVRFVVEDRPGILAALTGALAQHRINVDAVLQRPEHPKSMLPFVITLEPCRERNLHAAMVAVAGADFLLEAPFVMPILQ